MLKTLPNEGLAKWTSLGLGGPARLLCEVTESVELSEALEIAASHALPLRILGGGSNLVVSDIGVEALVIRPLFHDAEWEDHGEEVSVRAGADLDLDELVAESTRQGLWGLENLSGIPGTVGASPVQNVGAYGIEISELVEEVDVLNLENRREYRMRPSECRFSYRSSLFRRQPDSFLIKGLRLRLSRRPQPRLGYRDLAELAWPGDPDPALIRDRILEIRGTKGMLLKESSSRQWGSVGSFFVNPILSGSELEDIQQRISSRISARQMPDGSYKLPAARLIEESGFPRGLRRGPVGISPDHALALVHYGGGRSSDLLRLARDIQTAVEEDFGIQLKPEPVFWGFGEQHPLDLSRRKRA